MISQCIGAMKPVMGAAVRADKKGVLISFPEIHAPQTFRGFVEDKTK